MHYYYYYNISKRCCFRVIDKIISSDYWSTISMWLKCWYITISIHLTNLEQVQTLHINTVQLNSDTQNKPTLLYSKCEYVWDGILYCRKRLLCIGNIRRCLFTKHQINWHNMAYLTNFLTKSQFIVIENINYHSIMKRCSWWVCDFLFPLCNLY